ncbi:MAG: hypothetical protein L3J82_05930 [Planctomycetes bacterium]|nr:hypothetical protein [Planctomycetota bacterium]
MKILLACVFTLLVPALVAQSARDVAVEVTATVSNSPLEITLNWTSKGTSYDIYKRTWGSTSWGTPIATVSTLTWTDSSITSGTIYEYAVGATGGTVSAWGMICSGVDIAPAHSRGKLILVVDDTFTTSLAPELDRLRDDLTGDGWQVITKAVQPTDTVPSVKTLIVSEYNADPTNVKAVFLFGHVPVPYSGNIVPDGHTNNHFGAWTCDGFYGDMNGTWTDSTVNVTTMPARTNNTPGDGKYDQSFFPSDLELMVGRVDMFDLPAFTETEEQLLRRYLDKHHDFRTRVWAPRNETLIDDNFNYFNGEAFSASAWRSFFPLVGNAAVNTGDFRTDLTADSYLFAYGCGGGSYTSCSGVGTTANFAGDTLNAAFSVLFGSYFGDYDITNNLMRASLASDGYILTCAWSGRPWWYFHSMGMGEPIGESFLETVNAPILNNTHNQKVHIGLLGDPTLRAWYLAPATSTAGTHISESPVSISWTASVDTVAGYHVYRSSSRGGPYTLLSSSIVTGTSYDDSTAVDGVHYYMIRAQMLRTTPSGSYIDLSTGEIISVTVSGGTSPVGGTVGGGGGSGSGGGDSGCAQTARSSIAWMVLILLSAIVLVSPRRQLTD